MQVPADPAPILPTQAIDPNTKFRLKPITILSIGVTLLGCCISALYPAPSKSCAEEDECGVWLEQLTGHAQLIFLLSGIGSIVGLEGTLAYNSVKSLRDFLTKQKNKSLSAFALILYTATQGVQPAISSYGTGGTTSDIILSGVGAVPGSLYSAIGIYQRDLPYWRSLLSNYALKFYYKISTADGKKINIINNKLRLHDEIIKRCHLEYSDIIRQAKYGNISAEDYQLLDDNSVSSSAWKFLPVSAGIALSASLLMAINLNTTNVLDNFLPQTLSEIVTRFMTLSVTYTFTRLLTTGCVEFSKIIKNVLSNQPLPSLTFQLYPYSFSIISLINLAIASLSYASMQMMFIDNYPYEVLKSELSVIIKIAIGMLHFIGLSEFTAIQLERLTKNPEKKYLLAKAKALDNLSWRSYEQIINELKIPLAQLENEFDLHNAAIDNLYKTLRQQQEATTSVIVPADSLLETEIEDSEEKLAQNITEPSATASAVTAYSQETSSAKKYSLFTIFSCCRRKPNKESQYEKEQEHFASLSSSTV